MNQIKVGNAQFIHNLNQAGIFRLIHQYGPISRKELAENTGYSAATISNHVRTLIESGYLIETEKGDSTGGRKPIYLTVNPTKGYIITISIGVREVRQVIFNLKLKAEAETVFPIGEQLSPEANLAAIITQTKELLKGQGLTDDQLVGIGIAVPGLIDKKGFILTLAPNLGWSNLKIGDYFKQEFDLPLVLENEANAAVIGEREFLYPQVDNMVFVSINEGIGCGIIFNGKLYRGASGNAGEFGHIIIDNQGSKCHCGNYGCWETMASENYLINAYHQLTSRQLRANKIYQLVKQGDAKALRVSEALSLNIGIGLVNIINGLSPELIIVGGNIIRIKDYLQKGIKQVLAERALDISSQKAKLEFTGLRDMAALNGLAYLVHNECLAFS